MEKVEITYPLIFPFLNITKRTIPTVNKIRMTITTTTITTVVSPFDLVDIAFEICFVVLLSDVVVGRVVFGDIVDEIGDVFVVIDCVDIGDRDVGNNDPVLLVTTVGGFVTVFVVVEILVVDVTVGFGVVNGHFLLLVCGKYPKTEKLFRILRVLPFYRTMRFSRNKKYARHPMRL